MIQARRKGENMSYNIPSILEGDYSRDKWENKRRLEILNHFEQEVYGTIPRFRYDINFNILGKEIFR